MPENPRVEAARNAVWTHLRGLLPAEQWDAVSKGLDKVLVDAKDADLWLDAISNIAHMADAGKVAVVQLLMQAGRGAQPVSAVREQLMDYRIAGVPDYEQEIIQLPELTKAMQAWETAGYPSEGRKAEVYDSLLSEGQTQFQKLRDQGLLGQAAQPAGAAQSPQTLQGQAAAGQGARGAAFKELMSELERQ